MKEEESNLSNNIQIGEREIQEIAKEVCLRASL